MSYGRWTEIGAREQVHGFARYVSAVGLSLILALSWGLNIKSDYARPTPSTRRPNQPASFGLESLFAAGPAATHATNLPIWPANLRKLLGANEILYKRVDLEGVAFEVYTAHWRTGNPYAFEAAEHPPDGCWHNAGWVCQSARSDVAITIPEARLAPSEWRKFVGPGGVEQEVLFWCMVDQLPLNLGYFDPEPRIPREGLEGFIKTSEFLKFWAAAFRGETVSIRRPNRVIHGAAKSDVYFVRVNSSMPLNEVAHSRAFRTCQSFFTSLGVWQRLVDGDRNE